MPIRCPKCGRQHDVLEMQSAGEVRCTCGQRLDLSLLNNPEDFLRFFENEEDLEKAREVQEAAQWICQMILDENSEEVDIEIAKEELRQKVRRLFPDKMDTYRMIYEARFKRLWDQFRAS